MNILFVEIHNNNPFDIKWGSIQRSNLLIQGNHSIFRLDTHVP